MSKIAILSDIHGNLPAFVSVLKEVDRCAADRIVFGGDIVGYGASPAKCVEIVRKLGGHCVFGNHESMLIGLVKRGMGVLQKGWKENPIEAAIVHAYKTLPDDDINWIKEMSWLLPIDKKTILAHASLHDPESWPYIEDEFSAAPTIKKMENLGLELGFFGHIHQLGIFPGSNYQMAEDTPIRLDREMAAAVTVGSVGQPREFHDKRATWVLFDSVERTLEFKRTAYDQKQAARDIIEAGLPERSAIRLLD